MDTRAGHHRGSGHTNGQSEVDELHVHFSVGAAAMLTTGHHGTGWVRRSPGRRTLGTRAIIILLTLKLRQFASSSVVAVVTPLMRCHRHHDVLRFDVKMRGATSIVKIGHCVQ